MPVSSATRRLFITTPFGLAAAAALGLLAAPAQAKPARQAAAAESAPAFQLPVNARHALVLENGSGKVLMAKDADTQVPIASLTKLMTAMVVLDAKADLKARIRIQREDVDTLKHSPSRVPVGAHMTRGAALQLALMASDNRAAAALARTLPGGPSAFEQAVRAKIRALGLTRTEIAEPTGLSAHNRSTAAEMAKIAAAAARYPQISKLSSDVKEKVLINGRPVEFRNTNRLVGRKGWDIRLSKTGYTEEAGRCLALRLKDKTGRDVTVVLLDADGSAERLADAAKIRKSLERSPKNG